MAKVVFILLVIDGDDGGDDDDDEEMKEKKEKSVFFTRARQTPSSFSRRPVTKVMWSSNLSASE